MRISFCCVLCCTLIGLSGPGTAFGQDTNFARGPQYLMNPDSTNSRSPLLARPISTPSLSFTGPPLEVGASNETEGLVAGADTQTALAQPQPAPDLRPVYYGAPPATVIEVNVPENSSEPSREVPASILDVGVWQMTTPQALRERGYGAALAEVAAYRKAHAGHATRIYTNADINRLHGGN
jgi:hypothetical protein